MVTGIIGDREGLVTPIAHNNGTNREDCSATTGRCVDCVCTVYWGWPPSTVRRYCTGPYSHFNNSIAEMRLGYIRRVIIIIKGGGIRIIECNGPLMELKRQRLRIIEKLYLRAHRIRER